MVLSILTLLLLSTYAILISTYKTWWNKLPEYVPSEAVSKASLPFISVLIPARNEAENIKGLLLSLNQQTYAKELFEVILIDDHSEDETVKRAETVGAPNLRCISLLPGIQSKKAAIAAGVDAANGSLIVCTDADCIAAPEWLHTIAHFYAEKEAHFIAAPVKYIHRNTALHLLQTIDFLTLQGITAASVSGGFHTMCNGANLAYTKKSFDEVEGFAGIDGIASGDDMLLMHKIWKKKPGHVHYLKSEKAIVQTQPMQSWKDFVQQRIRWASKTTHYEDKRVFWTLVLIYFVNLIFFALLAAGFWNHFYWIAALVYLGLKTVIEFSFVTAVSRFYNQQSVMRYFFALQPLHIAYTVGIGLLSQMGKYQWKGRITR